MTLHNWKWFFFTYLGRPSYLNSKKYFLNFYINALNLFWKSVVVTRLGLPTLQSYYCVKNGLSPHQSPFATFSYCRVSDSSWAIPIMLPPVSINLGRLESALTQLGSSGTLYNYIANGEWRGGNRLCYTVLILHFQCG